MASIRRDNRTKKWVITFYWEGHKINRSCGTTDEKTARGIKARVEDLIQQLNLGRLQIPDDADPGTWIMSDGKLTTRPRQTEKRLVRLGEICEAYLEDQISKASNTVSCEKTHIGHLTRILKKSSRLRTIKLHDLQEYVNIRSKEKYHRRLISGTTIRKELATFRQIWDWALSREYVLTRCPIYGEGQRWAVKIPKPKEKKKFQTWKQIENQIKRGGLSDDEKKELWSSLFLDQDQIIELLEHVRVNASYGFMYPMFVFTAYTGARRSEIIRSQIEDFDFSTEQVAIREKKRKKDKAESVRYVPMHSKLLEVMQQWFDDHPGGNFTIALPSSMPRRKKQEAPSGLTVDQAHRYFKAALEGSKWEVVRGFHVLRHSFGSNLASSGLVPRDVIGKWMGHTTEEMMEHYQHLFPDKEQAQINILK